MFSSNFNKSMPSVGQPANSSSFEEESKVLPNWTNPALYKTRFCDHFRTKGQCKFGIKCWFAHGREELRSVPRLDRHPEAALDAVNQVIDSLPPSRSRKVAVSKGQQLYHELLMQKKMEGYAESPEKTHFDFGRPSKGQTVPRKFTYYSMPHAIFSTTNYTIVSNR